MRKLLVSLALLSFLAGSVLDAQEIEGVYLADENGIDSVWEISRLEDNRFSITDIFGEGFQGSQNNSQVILDDGGTASLTQTGDIIVQAGGRNLLLRRIFSTDSTFPLRRDAVYEVPEYFDGAWTIQEISPDLITGELQPFGDGNLVFTDIFTLSHEANNGIRFNDSQNVYFQGVPLNGRDIIFRIIRNPFEEVQPGFESIPGSTNNFFRDIIGKGHFSDINHFEVDLILQNFDITDPGGFLGTQALLNITGLRNVQVAEGDVDIDGVVNNQDRDALIALLGHDKYSPGYRIAADLDGNGLTDFSDLDRFDGQATPEKAAGPWMTGMWFDPVRSGEGFHIFVLDDERAIVTWFSYDPDGGQAWFIGVGRIEGNSIFVDETEVTRGTQFGAGFNPDDVIRENWGSIRINYEGCDNATVTFLSTGETFGNGGYRLQRLTTPTGVDCEAMNNSGSNSGRFTSAWFDPTRSGEGWFFEELPDGRIVVTWYTYDLQGRQMWLLGVGTIEDGVAVVPEMLLVEGGVFGSDFDPGAITETPWGSLRFEKTDCPNGQITYEALDPQFGTATREVILLAGVNGLGCDNQ